MGLEKPRSHINVDELQRQLTVSQVCRYYGFELPPRFEDRGEQRMRCPCRECSGHNDDRSVAINTGDDYKRWKCFRQNYGCGAKGNLVTLAYCLQHGAMPPSGKPTGREFFAIAQDLEAIAGGAISPALVRDAIRDVHGDTAATIQNAANVPLADSNNESARKLVNLDDQLMRDVAQLSPAASAYARRHPVLLSEEFCRQTRTGYMPGSSKSTLRGSWVYGILDEAGQPLAWVGRNVKYEDERRAYDRMGGQERELIKFRFPKQELFRRGLELYGQESLRDPRFAESWKRFGLILCEGFNDRLRLHQLGVLALGIMSNQITDEQVQKALRYAKEWGDGRIGLMFDTDAKGNEGAKEALWRLHEQGGDAYLMWSRRKYQGQFADREPESLTDDEWRSIAQDISHSRRKD